MGSLRVPCELPDDGGGRRILTGVRWWRGAQIGLLVVAAVALAVGVTGGLGTTTPVVAAAAQAQPPLAGVEHVLTVAGVRRTYRTFAPATGHDLPLLVVLHGRGQSPRTAIQQTGFASLAQQDRAAVVYPDGIGRSWNAGGGCCGVAGARGSADTAFVGAVVAASLRDLPVDAARVYLVGYSNGGKLAYAAACAEPSLYAAVATYGSVPLAPCRYGTPRPFLLAAGALDPILPFGGAAHDRPPLPPVRTAVGWLRAQDGCTGTPTSPTAGASTVQRWSTCRPGSGVTFVLYPRSGHTWPTSVSAQMWAFLTTSGLTPSG